MTEPLRLALILNPFTQTRRWGDHAPELARELSARGHTVRVFGPTKARTSRPPPEGAAELPRRAETNSPTDAPGSEGTSSAAPLEPLVPKRFSPDALVAYDALSPAAYLGARTARALSVPLLIVEAGTRRPEGPLARLYQGATELLWGRYVRRTASAIVALDPVARKRALVGGFPAERIVDLPPGIDPHAFRPGLASGLIQRHGIRGRILLYVGRIERNRGLEILIQAFARTVGQRDDWSLVLVGEGPARAELRASLDRAGIAARAHWLGRISEAELPRLFSSSTLVAVPALDDTVRGRNVARAMSCGRPVIASDLPSLRALVEHDTSGLLVPAGDLEAWTTALRRASMSPDARRRWGRRAREIAEARLSWKHVADVFESLILRARGHPAVPEASVGPLEGSIEGTLGGAAAFRARGGRGESA